MDVDKAWSTETVLSAWCRAGLSGEAGLFLLKLKYIEQRPIEKTAYDYRRKFKTSHSDSDIAAMIDEAECMYWILTTRGKPLEQAQTAALLTTAGSPTP